MLCAELSGEPVLSAVLVPADASKDGSAQHARGRDGALQEENALLKQEVQRLTAQLVSPAAFRGASDKSSNFKIMHPEGLLRVSYCTRAD